jgi:hypothetical protein
LHLALPEMKSLPCSRNTRQKWFGTRRSLYRVSTHVGPHTAANTTVKNLCRVSPPRTHGEAFAVCLHHAHTVKPLSCVPITCTAEQSCEWARQVPGQHIFTMCLRTHGETFTMFRGLPCVVHKARCGLQDFTVCLPLPCRSNFTVSFHTVF